MFEQIGVARLGAIDARALVERQQMRRSMATDAKTRAQQDRFEDGARGAFAVRAADGDDGTVETQAERILYLADAREAHVDADRMRGFQMGEPGVESGESVHFGDRESKTPRGTSGVSRG